MKKALTFSLAFIAPLLVTLILMSAAGAPDVVNEKSRGIFFSNVLISGIVSGIFCLGFLYLCHLSAEGRKSALKKFLAALVAFGWFGFVALGGFLEYQSNAAGPDFPEQALSTLALGFTLQIIIQILAFWRIGERRTIEGVPHPFFIILYYVVPLGFILIPTLTVALFRALGLILDLLAINVYLG